jgi:hypothetical protein
VLIRSAARIGADPLRGPSVGEIHQQLIHARPLGRQCVAQRGDRRTERLGVRRVSAFVTLSFRHAEKCDGCFRMPQIEAALRAQGGISGSRALAL